MQQSNIKKIKLILCTPIWTIIIVISKDAKDAEDISELAKKTFIVKLKVVRSELKGEIGDCKILIELVYIKHTL